MKNISQKAQLKVYKYSNKSYQNNSKVPIFPVSTIFTKQIQLKFDSATANTISLSKINSKIIKQLMNHNFCTLISS